MLAIAVDDLAFCSNYPSSLQRFKSKLNATLDFRIFGCLTSFIGGELTYSGQEIRIDHRRYIKKFPTNSTWIMRTHWTFLYQLLQMHCLLTRTVQVFKYSNSFKSFILFLYFCFVFVSSKLFTWKIPVIQKQMFNFWNCGDKI